MMDDMTYGIRKQPLPRDINNAQLLLQDHLANYTTVQDLYNFTTVSAQDVLSRAATSAAVSVSRDEIKGFLERSEGRHDEWRTLWEHHKDKLLESVRLCEFEQAISTVCSERLTKWNTVVRHVQVHVGESYSGTSSQLLYSMKQQRVGGSVLLWA